NVQRTRETVVVKDATHDSRFTKDPYLVKKHPKSILCLPILDRGQFIGLLYLENNLTTDAFTRDRLEVLKILSAQAAISIENSRLYEQLEDYSRTLEQKVSERTQELSQTLDVLKATQAELILENNLLRSDEGAEGFDYQIGGSLDVGSPTYVVRSADRHLYQAMRAGEFCYTFNARQMGKSSLMVRILKQLQEDGDRCIAIDLTRIGGENVTSDQWYKGFAVELWRGFGLLRKVKLKAWWADRLDIPAPQRLIHFIEEVLLVEVKKTESDEPAKMIIFLDEIDCTLSLNFPVNDFFALIRSCYNQRAIDPNYKRLTFALFGVATPSTLITDPQKTPFNIGHPIHLEGFKANEAQPLLYGLADKVNNPQTILREIIGWTGGQPFLTQKVCNLIRNAKSEIPINGEAQWLAELVRENILENWEIKDDPEHLKTIRDRLLKSPRSARLLELYRQILTRKSVVVADSPEEKELLLSGLVVRQEGRVKVNNRIYESIFDRHWLEENNQSPVGALRAENS
ncbi:MAG: AAA-like domain-containing protein, partial [Cyanobacteria bacterium SBLK]|nr:AAA-like domain-containing protein [Cyanobacteria bacterium SBLK]